jgi:hypothetical protein
VPLFRVKGLGTQVPVTRVVFGIQNGTFGLQGSGFRERGLRVSDSGFAGLGFRVCTNQGPQFFTPPPTGVKGVKEMLTEMCLQQHRAGAFRV